MTPHNRHQALEPLVEIALAEDLSHGDATEKIFPSPTSATAHLRARQPGVWCGQGISEEVFRQAGLQVQVLQTPRDGTAYAAGDVLEVWQGPGAMTTCERVILNFLQRLGAVASETARWVHELEGTECRLFDTRKTTPGWRLLEKYAVTCGGGRNNRLNLGETVMLKDNHFARLGSPRGSALTALIEKVMTQSHVPVIVEVEDVDACRDVARAKPAVILLDNMSLTEMKECVAVVRELDPSQRPQLEASGGISFDQLRDVAATGIDRISAGAITQAPPRLDLGLDWV